MTESPEWVAEPEQESEHVRSFRTHAAYLRALRHLALPETLRGAEHDLAALAARARGQVANGTAGAQVDLDGVLACLNRAWGTELILATTAELAADSEVIRLANSWGSVQAYYALYGAVQAVLVAEGRTRPDNHEATRKAFVDLWVTRRIDLPPWTLALGPAGTRGADTSGFLGGPGRPLDMTVHAWSSWNADECWDVAGKALRGTRRNHLEEQLETARSRKHNERRKQWRQEEQARHADGKRPRKQPPWWNRAARLTPEEKASVESRLRPTTVMDHLYRLRIRANYEDAALFSEGPESDSAARLWARDLVASTSASLLVHEMRLAQLLGDAVVRDAADRWLARNRSALSGTAGGLAIRRRVLRGPGSAPAR